MNARPQTTSPPITIWVCKSAGPIPPSTANAPTNNDSATPANDSTAAVAVADSREQGIDYGLDL